MQTALPNAVDLEEIVLGALISIGNTIDEVADILKPDVFYNEANKKIYNAIVSLYLEGKPIDLLTVKQRLEQSKALDTAGGVVYLTDLTSRVSSAAHIEYHARILLEHYLRRELIKLGYENVRYALDDTNDVFDCYQKAVTDIEKTLSSSVKYDVSHIGSIHNKLLVESKKVASSGQKSGVPTGFRALDNFTNGWQKGDLIILAGRPSMGKSVCGLSFALNPAVRENIPTAVFSLEMSSEQLVGRAQSNLSYLESSKIIKKQLTISEIGLLESRCGVLNNLPVYIDDTPSLTLLELKGKARKLVKDKGVKLLVIDYLQLMNADHKKNQSREQEVSQISRGLKALAKELSIPIIALSQLNRLVESRNEKRPTLSDLRESGSIEQDADMVIFTYRPEYYGIPTYEMGGETMSSDGLMVLIVAKHRAGSLGELRLGFNGNLTKLENYDTFIQQGKQSAEQRQPASITNSETSYSPF